MRDERTRKAVGICLLFLAVFFFVGGLSFVFTGTHDQRLVSDSIGADDAEPYRNILGALGAHAGYQLVHRGFGLGSLLLPLLLVLYGIRILIKKSLLPLGKSTRIGLLTMLYLPVLIGFFFSTRVDERLLLTCNDNLVGEGGLFLLQWLTFHLGGFGTLLLLILVLGIAVTINFNPSFENWRIPSGLKKLFAKKDTGEPVSSERSIENEEEVVTGNRPKDLSTQAETADRADAALDEIIGTASASAREGEMLENDLPFEPDFEEVEEVETEVPEESLENKVSLSEKLPVASELTAEESEESDMEIELAKEDDELSEDELEDRTQSFGSYDPKLDLSRYELPNIDLLEAHGSGAVQINKEELEVNKNRIVETLNNYNIEISKIKATVGPTVTLYEIIPAPGVRISKIKNLEDDIALSLAALGIRIIAPIPGKGTIGIEVPNSNPNVVAMRSLIASDKFQNSDMELPIAIGKTISNETFTFDLAKMPHLLMAGATGQGKSVGLNAMLVSLLYKKHPSQLKFVLVDPKKVELTLFNKIERHFLAKLPDEEEPIITDTSKVVTTLNSLCVEMDDRYELLKIAQCRNIKEYNNKFVKRKLNPENGHRYLPYIVLVVDEFADLIMTAGKEVETPIARLAQLARAIGIHLIIATQRPSVNIITGTIKANFPARIAFRVTSKIDSRTILDAGGADQLIGRGDMLFSTGSDLIRIQCGFVDTPEVEEITDFIGSQQGYPQAFLLPEYHDESSGDLGTFDASDRDELFEEAARVIVMHQQGSTSLLQRKLKLGYNRAGRLIDQLEAAGIIGPFEGSKARKVLVPDEASLEQLLQS